MKKLCYAISVFILAAELLSCSDTPTTQTSSDTTTAAVPLRDTSARTAIAPDPSWTNPTEIVSQYGPSGIVRDVVVDRDGIIWLAAWDGVVSYDGKQFTNHTLKDGLSHHRIYSVMEDRNGNIWFGSMGAGVLKYDGTRFTTLNTNSGLIHNTVFDIFEDAGGNIWFATPQGVSRYDGKSFMNLGTANGLNQEVYAVSQDTYGTLWIGGEAGLFHYTPSANDSMVTEILTEQGTHYANVRDLCYSNGTMYFGAARGFYVSKPLSHVPLKITLVNDKLTSYVCADNSGNLLLTSDGIFRYHVIADSPSDADYDRYTPIVEGQSSLGIFGAREAQDGSIWYGAMDGLHRYDGTSIQSFKR